MCDLKNKNSLIYSELIKAIDIFNKGIPYYFILEKASKKLLKAYDIEYRRCIDIKLSINNLYHDWDFDYLLKFNEEQFHVMYIDYNY